MNALSPITPAEREAAKRQAEQEAQSIVSICEREIERLRTADFNVTPWLRNGLLDLQAIKASALEVIDHLAGHEGFEHAPAELDTLLTEWAENTDFRTFPDTPALDALDGDPAMGALWNDLLREGRAQLQGRR